jgi:serine/threonine protein kinase
VRAWKLLLDSTPPSRRYELGEEIARGGMGVIYRARDKQLNRDLAIKVLRAEHQDNSELLCRFIEEAQIGAQLQHPGIVPVHELGRLPDGRPFLAMKLVQGRNLSELLAARSSPHDELPQFLKIFEQVCQALAYAHSHGVIHRDLKPSNIMVGAFGEVQVMDWGLAKARGDRETLRVRQGRVVVQEVDSAVQTVRSAKPDQATHISTVIGTPAYMAPEQARGQGTLCDEGSDVFGLGAILCEILTGQPPYNGPTASDVYRQAVEADLTAARARLAAVDSGTNNMVGYYELALMFLEPDRDRRPHNAQAAATAVSMVMANAQQRQRDTEQLQIKWQAQRTTEQLQRYLEQRTKSQLRADANETPRRRIWLRQGLGLGVLLALTIGFISLLGEGMRQLSGGMTTATVTHPRLAELAPVYRAALLADPTLPARQPQLRVHAARAACAAAVTESATKPTIWRHFAYGCLRAEFAQATPAMLQEWLADPCFEVVRTPEKLAHLPAAEQATWTAFWDEVRAKAE